MFFFCSKSSETSKKINQGGESKIEEGGRGGGLYGVEVKIADLARLDSIKIVSNRFNLVRLDLVRFGSG